MKLRNMFKVGIITVPSRTEAVKVITDELDKYEIEYVLFNDEKYQGQPFNFDRMLKFFCEKEFDENIILCTDDIKFKDGWVEKIKEVLDNTDYNVIGCYSNKIQNQEKEIYNGVGKHCLYDVCVVYRSGVLNKDYYERFNYYANMPTRSGKELKHYDIMNSHFLRDTGGKVCVIRPNVVTLQKIKSSLNHKCKIED